MDSFSDTMSTLIADNIFYACGASGINCGSWGAGTRGMFIINNTFDSNTSDGIKVTAAPADGLVVILNNIFSNNGSYGLEFSNAGATDNAIAVRVHVQGNQTYLNTTNAYKSITAGYAYNACPWASGDTGLNPTYATASSGNFMIGTNLKAQGYPLGGTLAVGTGSSTYSYIDPGAAQRQESSSGGMMSPIEIFGIDGVKILA